MKETYPCGWEVPYWSRPRPCARKSWRWTTWWKWTSPPARRFPPGTAACPPAKQKCTCAFTKTAPTSWAWRMPIRRLPPPTPWPASPLKRVPMRKCACFTTAFPSAATAGRAPRRSTQNARRISPGQPRPGGRRPQRHRRRLPAGRRGIHRQGAHAFPVPRRRRPASPRRMQGDSGNLFR